MVQKLSVRKTWFSLKDQSNKITVLQQYFDSNVITIKVNEPRYIVLFVVSGSI